MHYEEFSFKTNFPKNWKDFGEILIDLFDFDVLHLNYQKQMITPLFYDIKNDGIYLKFDDLNSLNKALQRILEKGDEKVQLCIGNRLAEPSEPEPHSREYPRERSI